MADIMIHIVIKDEACSVAYTYFIQERIHIYSFTLK